MRADFSAVPKTAPAFLSAILCICIAACKSTPKQPAVQPNKTQAIEAPLPPPTLDDVRAKVDSIYHGALKVDEPRKPKFLVGDFNGDNSQDILVAVRPAPTRLADLNSDLAAWIVEDPRLIWVPDPSRVVQRMPPARPHPARIQAGNRLWAIIHGFRENGWRNPMATQSYLLVNVAANGLQQESARQASTEFEQSPLPLGIQYLLRYHGEVLRETIGRRAYLLYWTGGHYARTKIETARAVPQKLAGDRGKAKEASRRQGD
ncbi:MAG TPA: hypothetical protein VJV96_09695 [Candidatus Angelobacter sp.]|jgi:hypothetical protein|nr:hypothetical protein [Candidatus Angelobacter sp.]